MAADYFDDKFFKFEDFYPVFSTVTAVSKLIALQRRADWIHEKDNAPRKSIYIPVRLKNGDNLLYDDALYYHLASAFWCSWLYQNALGSNKLMLEFIKYILSDLLEIEYAENDDENEYLLKLYYEIMESSDEIQEIINVISQRFIDYGYIDIFFYDRFEALAAYNRVVHDNLRLCFVNEGTTRAYFDSIIKKVIDDEIRQKLDDIIREVKSESGKTKRNGRCSCLVRMKNNENYFSISGIWDRGFTNNNEIRRLLLKPALEQSEEGEDNDMLKIVKGIGIQNYWKFCFIASFTECYCYDKTQKQRSITVEEAEYYRQKKPLKFIEHLRALDECGILDDEKGKIGGRMFSCSEKKIISYLKYCVRIKRRLKKSRYDPIKFYIDREPCIMCKESIEHFEREFGLKNLYIYYVDK